MTLSIRKNIPVGILVIILLILFSFVPDVGIKIAMAGFTWTPYRIVVFLSLLILILRDKRIVLCLEYISTKWIILLFFWIVYGIVLLFLSKYSDFHNGIIELLSLLNGMIVIYLMSMVLTDLEYKEFAESFVFILLNLMVVFGLFEILSGFHWISSGFNDPNSRLSFYENAHKATGFLYNMNDFSAMITCMSPILLLDKFGRKRILTLICVIAINVINDATTCTLAMMVFVLYYIFIIVGGKEQRAFIMRVVFAIIFVTIIVVILSYGLISPENRDFFGALARQIHNAKNESGSLYVRLVLYKEALNAWFTSAIFGMGPGGFSNYFNTFSSKTDLVNPHSLLLEILTQYGLIVILCFLGLLIYMYHRASICYRTKFGNKNEYLMVIAFTLVYPIASFAPSSFIGYSYQWILIAIMCSQLDILNSKRREEYA